MWFRNGHLPSVTLENRGWLNARWRTVTRPPVTHAYERDLVLRRTRGDADQHGQVVFGAALAHWFAAAVLAAVPAAGCCSASAAGGAAELYSADSSRSRIPCGTVPRGAGRAPLVA